MKRSLKARIPIVPAFRSEAAQYPQSGGPPPVPLRTPRYFTQTTPLRATALLGHLIVVAAFERHPVGFQVLRARQVFGPGIARDQGRRLPNDVQMGGRAALARESRVWEVKGGQQLGGSAGEV